jgi:phenylalanyl-tRNA synthetase alpha chain
MHPIRQFLQKSVKIFNDLGFEVVEGPDVETEWYNFDSLRMFSDHPARDIQDTFWLTDGRVLRTQTSSMQVREMEKRKPPVRIIVPGRVYRHEATDASHETNFYQLEGFAIDKNINFAQLIGTLKHFMTEIYGKDIKIRVRPGYFPFTEPSLEMDIAWKDSKKWEEVLGAGMIHQEVLKNMGVDPKKYQGFAFGLGIDRLMMLNYNIKDIRLSYSGDLRFLKQF